VSSGRQSAVSSAQGGIITLRCLHKSSLMPSSR
jgi:hypothetical protein